MIRILLADDHALMREGLKQLFSLTTGINIAGEAVNGAQTLEILRKGSFDLLLMDMSMPGISGTDLIARILAQTAPPPILVLSMHNEPLVARRALSAGAAGYLSKDSDPAILLSAVRKVASGGRFIDPTLAEAIAFASEYAQQNEVHGHLSGREFQILCLLAKGRSVNDIASELIISNKTVSTHKARLMEKMGFTSNADLVRYAVEHQLVI